MGKGARFVAVWIPFILMTAKSMLGEIRCSWPAGVEVGLGRFLPVGFGELPFIQVVEYNFGWLFRGQLAAGMAENR